VFSKSLSKTLSPMSTRGVRIAEPPQRAQWVVIAAFFGAILAMNLDLMFGLDPNPSPVKNPVSFPALHWDGRLKKFPGDLRHYLASNMGFRGALVRARARIVHGLLGGSASESVIRHDPWLFLRSEHMVEEIRHTAPFKPGEIDAWRRALEARARWLAERNIRFLVVVAPDKETIYADQLPSWVRPADHPSRLAQLGAVLKDQREVSFLDLSATLRAAKQQERVYHYTDTHWNDAGAFAGYLAIAERLEPWFPRLTPLAADKMIRTPRVTPGGDLARMSGLQFDLTEPQVQLSLPPEVKPAVLADGSPLQIERMDVRGSQRFVTNGNGEIPSALVLRDSYGEALLPYVAAHVGRATWLWTYDFPADDIERERPALVIEELVERKLMVVEPVNPPVVGGS
jgi:alginate O-acetyltransferase complex protein AlgJ